MNTQADTSSFGQEPNKLESPARDRFALTRKELLEDYVAISSKRRGAAAACAIRHQSRQYLDVLAVQAIEAFPDWHHLRAALVESMLSGHETDIGDPAVLAEIARVLMVSPLTESDLELGTYLLENVIRRMPKNFRTRRFRLLLVQQYILSGRRSDAKNLIEAWPDIKRMEDGFLLAELENPFKFPDQGDLSDWMELFNGTLNSHGLSPVFLNGEDGEPFDRVTSSAFTNYQAPQRLRESIDQPLVSVILTAYQPGYRELKTSVQSLLDQSLQNIEILIVDDCSGSEYSNVFSAIAQMDSRISVHKMPINSGTYAARNLGYGLARGQFVTGQDDDDWSHPQRLEKQVEFLLDNPEVAGCRIAGIMCDSNLSRLRLGYQSINSNASSLMMQRDRFELAGGFIEMRKAADTEFMRRLERLVGTGVEDLPEPLSLVRILPDSLSRSEFKAGWSHPARRQVKSAYGHWHATAKESELSLPTGSVPSVYIPRRFRMEQVDVPEKFDVIIAGDWRQYGGPQKSMIEEIRALRAHGFRTAVLHLEAPRFMSTKVKPLNPHIQEMINNGEVDEVLYDDNVITDLLILRYPPILQFAPDKPSGIECGRMFILANQAPSERDGRDVRYLVQDCLENARRIFTSNVTWVPQGPQVREAIGPYLQQGELEEFDLPGIVDPAEWRTSIPRRPRSGLPVIGRHSRDNSMKWPEDAATIEQVYPTNGMADIRIMGGASVPQGVLNRRTTPSGWIVYPTDALPVPTFLRSLDFFVFYQNSIAVEAFGRAILEAIASNLVVILPRHYEPVFGEAALYCEPKDVSAMVSKLRNDWSKYVEQQEAAASVLEQRFSHSAFVRRIRSVIAELSSGAIS